MNEQLELVGLRHLPFEFAASGPPAYGVPWVPNSWAKDISEMIERLYAAGGPKSIIIEGEYGSGKSVVIRWLAYYFAEKYRVRPFMFSNPGVTFYGLANDLLGSIGRKEFAKVLWEIAASHVAKSESKLFQPTFDEKLREWLQPNARRDDSTKIAEALQIAHVTNDEEVAYRLSKLVVECAVRPYLTYTDFTVKDGLAAENKEPAFFSAILKALRIGKSAEGCAFLIDEFEEISIGAQVTQKVKQDYTATLRRLLDEANTEQLWVVLAMIPEGRAVSRRLAPAAWQRLELNDEGNVFKVPSLTSEEAAVMIGNRLEQAGAQPSDRIWSFKDAIIDGSSPTTLANPRKLIRLCARTLSVFLQDPDAFNSETVQSEDQALMQGEN